MAEREVERTADGRWVVVDGRRWRAADPAIPEDRAAALRSALASARSRVRVDRADPDAVARHRARVHEVKTALGERGTPWWEQTDAERRERWERPDLDAPPRRG